MIVFVIHFAPGGVSRIIGVHSNREFANLATDRLRLIDDSITMTEMEVFPYGTA